MAAVEFLEMPRHIARLEQDVDGIKRDVKEVLKLVKQERSSEDKSGWIVTEGENT